MISKEMYCFLKQTQRAPRKSEFREIIWNQIDKNVLKGIIREALELGYIYTNTPDKSIEVQWWHLTEKGACAVQEYKHKYLASKKSTIALVLSGLSLLASIVAIIVSIFK